MLKRLAVVAFILAGLGTAALAASRSYQQSTSLSTSTAAALPSLPSNPGAGSALISVEGAAIRWRDDGTAPTSSVGQPISAGQAICYAQDLGAFQMIGQTGSPTVNVTYYNGKYCAF